MRVGLYLADLRHEGSDSQGIVNYAASLANELSARQEAGIEYHILASQSLVESGLLRGGDNVTVLPDVASLPRRLWSDHVRCLRWGENSGLDVLHFPKGFIPLRSSSIPTIATVHDDIPLQMSGRQPLTRRAKNVYVRQMLTHSLTRATRVITGTDWAKRRLLKYGSPIAEISVIPHASPLPEIPFQGRAERTDRIVIFDSRHPHKAVAQALSWLDALISSENLDLTVEVMGRAALAEYPQMANPRFVRNAEWKSPQELAEILSRSRLFVLNSHVEGFGLPAIEAVSAGTPIAWAKSGAVSELLSFHPGGYDLDDPRSFGKAVDAVLRLPDRELMRLANLARERYNWRRTGDLTSQVYRAATRGR